MAEAARFLLAALVVLLGAGSAAGDYLLSPGDRLRVSIAGLPEGDWSVTIGPDGRLRLPHLGGVQAAGLDLDGLHAALEETAAGTMAALLGPEGRVRRIPLLGADIFVEIAAPRPVLVTGPLRAPGEIAYRPGLTVRAALALAGGPAPLAPPGTEDPARWRLALETARLDAARLGLELWTAEAALARDPDRTPPETAPGDLLAAERARLGQALADLAERRAALAEQLTLSGARSAALTRTRATYAEAVAAEEDELARIAELFERGRVAMGRLADMRRGLLATSTRLLEVEDGIAAEAQRRAVLSEERRRLDAAFDARWLAERSRLLAARLEASAQARHALSRLAASGFAPEAGTVLSVTLHRQGESGIERRPADLDDPVEPGDILEASLVVAQP